jgi:hypothetical protein
MAENKAWGYLMSKIPATRPKEKLMVSPAIIQVVLGKRLISGETSSAFSRIC